MESDDYNIQFLLDYLQEKKDIIGNPDLFRKSLYEKHFLNVISGRSITSSEACFAGTLYLEEEKITDTYIRLNKTWRRYLKDFLNLNINQYFGISIYEYMNFTPKDILLINSLASEKIREENMQISKEIKHLGSFEG